MNFFGIESLSKSFRLPWSSSPDTTKYTNAAQHVIELGHHLLNNEKYRIVREDSSGQVNTKANTLKEPLSSIRLKISLYGNPTEISNVEKEEINVKFLQELENRLTSPVYSRLITKHGKMKEEGSYYFIDLNVEALGSSKLSSTLSELLNSMSRETEYEKSEREKAYREKKDQYEIKTAEEKVQRARLTRANSLDVGGSGPPADRVQRFTSADRINTKFRNSQKRLSAALGGAEFRSLMAQQAQTFPHIEENFQVMYVIYRSYRDALDKDDVFRSALIKKYSENAINKINEDTDLLLACFNYYLEGDTETHPNTNHDTQNSLQGHIDYQNNIRKIFGSPDWLLNRVKYEGYVRCAESIEQFSNRDSNNMEMSGKMRPALQYCYGYIYAKEKKYTEPIGCLIDAFHFKLGYPHLTFEPQFEVVDQQTRTVSGSLKSIRLEVSLYPNGSIRNKTDFDTFVTSLKKLIGEERFNRLVLSYDPIRVRSDKEEQTFYLYLHPVELQTITLEELMPDLSPDDMQMYSTMRTGSVTNEVTQVKVDQVAQMNKDFLAMYEIYAKFKLSTSPEGIKLAFASDPDFYPNKKLVENQQLNFIAFIKANESYLNTIMKIFDRKKLKLAVAKYERYINECQMKFKYTHSNVFIAKWYASFEELVRCCGRVVSIGQLISDLRHPDKTFPILAMGQTNELPLNVMNLIFDDLAALSSAEKSSTGSPEKARTMIRTSPVKSKTIK